MTRFLARRLLNYIVLLALASFLTFTLASVAFKPLDSLLQRNPRPPQSVDRRQARRARSGQANTRPLRPLGRRCGARRLRHHDRRATGVGRTVAAHRSQSAAAGHRLGAGHRDRRRGRRVGRDPAVPAERPRHHRAVAVGHQHADVRDREPVDPRRAAGQFGAGRAAVRVHRRDVAGRGRRSVEPIRRPAAASGAADVHAGARRHRRLQPISAQRDARRARPGLHPHRARQGTDPTPRAVQTRPAHRADPDGDAVRLQRRRAGHRRGVRREDLRLARHRRMGRAGIATQDTNIVAAVTVFSGATILLAGLLSDVIYAALDPRVRVS